MYRGEDKLVFVDTLLKKYSMSIYTFCVLHHCCADMHLLIDDPITIMFPMSSGMYTDQAYWGRFSTQILI